MNEYQGVYLLVKVNVKVDSVDFVDSDFSVEQVHGSDQIP